MGGPPRILRLTPERDSKCCWFVAAGRKACLVDHETTTGPLQKSERRSGKNLTVARIRGVALRTIDPNGPAAPGRPERARGAASRKAKKKDPKMASAIEKALKRLLKPRRGAQQALGEERRNPLSKAEKRTLKMPPITKGLQNFPRRGQ